MSETDGVSSLVVEDINFDIQPDGWFLFCSFEPVYFDLNAFTYCTVQQLLQRIPHLQCVMSFDLNIHVTTRGHVCRMAYNNRNGMRTFSVHGEKVIIKGTKTIYLEFIFTLIILYSAILHILHIIKCIHQSHL